MRVDRPLIPGLQVVVDAIHKAIHATGSLDRVLLGQRGITAADGRGAIEQPQADVRGETRC
jgi:hypothetical protein